MSDSTTCERSVTLAGLGLGAVENGDGKSFSITFCCDTAGGGGCSMVGSRYAETVGNASVKDVERLARSNILGSFVSFIDTTIRSSSSGEMGLHLDRTEEKLSAEDISGVIRFIWIDGDDVVDWRCSSSSSSSVDAIESTLADNSGVCFLDGYGFGVCCLLVGVSGNRGFESQQKVSLFHNLQLKFSKRLPSSIDSAHRLKTENQG